MPFILLTPMDTFLCWTRGNTTWSFWNILKLKKKYSYLNTGIPAVICFTGVLHFTTAFDFFGFDFGEQPATAFGGGGSIVVKYSGSTVS